jgi:hypothetical protein
LLLAGCENTAGAAGDSGQSGKDVSPRRLTGSKTTSIIQHEIDSNANLVFEGCVQSDEGMVSIPANRKVELVGTKAYQPHASGCLIIAETASVTGTGKIAEVKGAVFIAPQAVLDTNTGIGTDTTKIAYQTIGTEGAITFRDNIAAVNGNATIGSTGETGTTIPATSLNGKTLYVVGNLTVSNAVTAELIAVGGGGVMLPHRQKLPAL